MENITTIMLSGSAAALNSKQNPIISSGAKPMAIGIQDGR